jgi:DNA-binding transcriptional ArsR family regulator
MHSVDSVSTVLSALSDPRRRQLLELLAEQGEATATTLAGRLPVSRQSVVKHLAVLDAAGLVHANRVGREVRYTVRTAAVDATTQWLSALAVNWDRRLANITRLAETAERDAHYSSRNAHHGNDSTSQCLREAAPSGGDP